MPAAAPEHRMNLTLTMSAEMGAKVEQISQSIGTSKNALMCGLIAVMEEPEMRAFYDRALRQGLVAPRNRISPEARMLMNKLGHLSPEKLEAMLAKLEG